MIEAGGAPVWVLLGKRKGDNAQVLALADALGLPYRTIQLRYNPLRLVPPALLGASTISLKSESQSELHAPWPELVLGIGYRSVPPALAIRALSGGKSRLVRLGNPRIEPSKFDLVITTPQYAVPEAPNVVRLPVAITAGEQDEPNEAELKWLAALKRPHRLLIVGGPTFMWTLRSADVARAGEELCERLDGSVIAISSPRTPAAVKASVQSVLQGKKQPFVDGGLPRYRVLLNDADEIYVTGDSVSMVSEAIATRRPVGLIPPVKTLVGKLLYSFAKLTGTRVPVRDLERFRNELGRRKLVGSLASPFAAEEIPNPIKTATEAVRTLLV